jgi:predicted ATPase
MIESIRFENFKGLQDATLPLGRFTLVVGANGTGKSTALGAPMLMNTPQNWIFDEVRMAGTPDSATVVIEAKWRETSQSDDGDFLLTTTWRKDQMSGTAVRPENSRHPGDPKRALEALARSRLFSLDAKRMAEAVQLRPNVELDADGFGLAGALDRMRDQHPENFESLNTRLGQWFPDFDRVVFETAQEGRRSICLRTREGHVMKAWDLAQGTLLALGLLTIAYLPAPPPAVCIKDPDRGLHPRLLRDVREVLSRLAYPENGDGQREPVQVVMTTHNPYFLDLFRGHPEQIVIAEKDGLAARFSRLSERTDLTEVVREVPLSRVWDNREPAGLPAGIKSLLSPRNRPQIKLR